MPRLIEITVAPDGTTTVQTKGYAGSDCLQASQFLEQALGQRRTDQRSAEFYETEPARQALRQ